MDLFYSRPWKPGECSGEAAYARTRTSELKQLNGTSPSVVLSSTPFLYGLSFDDLCLHDGCLSCFFLKALACCSFGFSLHVFIVVTCVFAFNFFPFFMLNFFFSHRA